MHQIPVCYWIKEAARALTSGSSDFYYTLAPYSIVARRTTCRQSVTGVHASSFQSVEVNASRGRVRHQQPLHNAVQNCAEGVNREFKGGKWLSNIRKIFSNIYKQMHENSNYTEMPFLT